MVTFDIESSSYKILRKAENLKCMMKLNGIFIKCDRSKKERRKEKRTVTGQKLEMPHMARRWSILARTEDGMAV